DRAGDAEGHGELGLCEGVTQGWCGFPSRPLLPFSGHIAAHVPQARGVIDLNSRKCLAQPHATPPISAQKLLVNPRRRWGRRRERLLLETLPCAPNTPSAREATREENTEDPGRPPLLFVLLLLGLNDLLHLDEAVKLCGCRYGCV